MADILEQLIGVRTGGRSQHSRWPPRGENVIRQVEVTLEEVYNGATRYGPCLVCASRLPTSASASDNSTLGAGILSRIEREVAVSAMDLVPGQAKSMCARSVMVMVWKS